MIHDYSALMIFRKNKELQTIAEGFSDNISIIPTEI